MYLNLILMLSGRWKIKAKSVTVIVSHKEKIAQFYNFSFNSFKQSMYFMYAITVQLHELLKY